MPFDLHPACERYLGLVHTTLALTPQASCPSCKHLPEEEKKRRLAIFTPLEDDKFPLSEHHPLDEVLDIYDAKLDSDESASDTESLSNVLIPLLPVEEPGSVLPSQTVSLPMLALTPIPAMGALVCALPDIIVKADATKWIPVPPPQAPPLTDNLAGKFASLCSSKGDPVWLCFPAVTAYLSGAAPEPLEQKAPVSTFAPIT